MEHKSSGSLTGPVEGDGRGVHADGHGSLLLLEELSGVPRALGDDGLRLLDTHTHTLMLHFVPSGTRFKSQHPPSSTLPKRPLSSFSEYEHTSTSDSFLSRLRSSTLGSVACTHTITQIKMGQRSGFNHC